MKSTTWMKAPNGTIRKVEGDKLAASLAAQGWTTTDERPEPKPKARKPGSYYVNHSNLAGW